MGLDVERLLDEAERMLQACAPAVPAAENPGLALGVTLGVLARHGIDKLTLVASPAIHDLGAWLEQLIAESTGKNGKGIVPVDRETVAAPDHYGKDRALRVPPPRGRAPMPRRTRRSQALEKAGQPVVRIDVATKYDLGGGIHPLGDRDGDCRRRDRHQPVRSAGRGSEQNRDARADERVREKGLAAGRSAVLRGQRHQAVRRREERRGAEGRGEDAVARPAISRRISRGSAPATTSHCSRTSR